MKLCNSQLKMAAVREMLQSRTGNHAPSNAMDIKDPLLQSNLVVT